jgi:hypothetical protein
MLFALDDLGTSRMGGFSPEPVYFQAPDYTHWTVHEVRDPTASTGQALIFVSSAGFRRVRTYPPHWRSLSPSELWELSWQR